MISLFVHSICLDHACERLFKLFNLEESNFYGTLPIWHKAIPRVQDPMNTKIHYLGYVERSQVQFR
jgi:hypothetical protein